MPIESNKSNESTFQSENHLKYGGTASLFATEKFLKNYNNDVVSKLASAFCLNDEILEFGAGVGTLSVLWKVKTGKKPDCLEVDEAQCEILRQRGLSAYSELNDLNKIYDGIYTSNVLEHIENDLDTLSELKKCLKEDGVLAIYTDRE